MARGARVGADQTDTTKPLIATTDVIVGGPFDGSKLEVVLAAFGPDTAPVLVTAATGLPVALDPTSLAAVLTALETVQIGNLPAIQPVQARGLAGAIAQKVTTVGATAVPIPAAALANRVSVLVQNRGTSPVWVGSATVTADDSATGGIVLQPGESMPLDLAAGAVLFAISTLAGQAVATLEVAS